MISITQWANLSVHELNEKNKRQHMEHVDAR